MEVVMVWAPSEQNRTAIRFWLDCLQVVTVVAGVSTAVATFVYHGIEERHRADDQASHAREQLDNARRELERPYQEKKLQLYLDAARVLAHLATSPSVDKDHTEARFWELYWGELAFVESTTAEEASGPNPSVESLMVRFCRQYFAPERCSSGGGAATRTSAGEDAAINMARAASKEIRDQWTPAGKPH
jgi:hypothetical protein